jgi:hypothetical protein
MQIKKKELKPPQNLKNYVVGIMTRGYILGIDEQ